MAIQTLSQNNTNCQGVSEKELKIFKSTRTDYTIAAVILTSPIQRAVEALRICGFEHSVPIPEYVFVTAEAIAKFYNVKETYIKSVLARYGILRRNMPDDVKTGSEFARMLCDHKASANDRYTIKGSCYRYEFMDNANYGMKASEIVIGPQAQVFSARVFLAISALMRCGKTIPLNSVSKRVYDLLLKMNYYQEAMERIYKLRLPTASQFPPVSATEPVSNKPMDTAPISPDGTVAISLEGIKSVVGETMSEFAQNMIETIKSTMAEEIETSITEWAEAGYYQAIKRFREEINKMAESTLKPEIKKRKASGCCGEARIMPQNWKSEYRKYCAGKITKQEFSEAVGIPYNSLYRYMLKWG